MYVCIIAMSYRVVEGCVTTGVSMLSIMMQPKEWHVRSENYYLAPFYL